MKQFFLFLLTFLSVLISANEFTIVRTFPFGDEFPWASHSSLDGREDLSPGIRNLGFLRSGKYYFSVSKIFGGLETFYLFDQKHNKYFSRSLDSFSENQICDIVDSQDYFILQYTDSLNILDKQKSDFSNFQYKIGIEKLRINFLKYPNLYVYKNFIVLNTKASIDHETFDAVELLEGSQFNLINDKELKKDGFFGININYSDSVEFHEERTSFVIKNVPAKYDYQSASNPYYWDFLGEDSKGCKYFKLFLGRPSGKPDSDKYSSYASNVIDTSVKLVVMDPWADKVIIREYPDDTWNVPHGEFETSFVYRDSIGEGVLYIYPEGEFSWAVHPSGSVYFTDMDLNKRLYNLKKLENTWWSETGSDKRVVGRITEYKVPVYSNPDMNSEIIDYSYYDDYILLKQKKSQAVYIDDKECSWIFIERRDNKSGWILSNQVYIPDYKELFVEGAVEKGRNNKILGILNNYNVRLRTEPNLDCETIKLLEENEKVQILSRSKEKQKIGEMNSYWYKVQLEDGSVGWVYGHFVDIIKK